MIARDGAEHGARLRFARSTVAKYQQLIEQRQAIAHAAVGRLRQQFERSSFVNQLLSVKDERQPRRNHSHRQPFEIELQTAR